MKAHFNLEKDARKALVNALCAITGSKAEYQGAPSFAFSVGGYIIDRHGTVDFGEENHDKALELLETLSSEGFICEGDFDGNRSDAPEQHEADDTAPVPVVTDDNLQTSEDMTCADEEVSPVNDTKLSIDIPLSGFTASAIDNLKKLVSAKGWIIRKMIGADDLPIVRETDRLCFPWFMPESSAAEVDAYSRLVAGLCETAKSKKRVTSKERRLEEGDNEKFKARCFLISLGFIGDDTKQARKILLASMSGNGSHRAGNGVKHARGGVTAAIEDPGNMPFVDYSLAETLADGELIHNVNNLFESDSGSISKDLPAKCGEYRHHCYYTDGLMRTSAGDTVDTSNREPDGYTHYCLGTTSGMMKGSRRCRRAFFCSRQIIQSHI